MPRYLATLKTGDQILTTAETENEARAHLADVYHVRDSGYSVVLDNFASAREEFLELLAQGARLLALYRSSIEEAKFASLDGETSRLLERLDSLGLPPAE